MRVIDATIVYIHFIVFEFAIAILRRRMLYSIYRMVLA